MIGILFTIILSILFSFQLKRSDIFSDFETGFKGDLKYALNYTDSTKQELENFRVWYRPKI